MRVQPPLFPTAAEAVAEIGRTMRKLGRVNSSEKWQSVDSPAAMLELLEAGFRCPIPDNVNAMAKDVQPNRVWADLHFAERVSRRPTNPGTAYKFWPYFKAPSNKDREDEALRHEEKFTHTYQERIWAKGLPGIWYDWGDLDDVVELLKEQPRTRQAFLPIFFPEDTGAVHRGRIPCTIGYLFMQREGYLHCTYYIRSCDYFRHFRDDIYLAMRLTEWVRDEVGLDWELGMLNMYLGSIHCWETERELLPK